MSGNCPVALVGVSAINKFLIILGDILAFDNARLVHGRTGYQDTDGMKRFLVGNFIDWDEIYCKIRVLKRELTQ